MRCRFLHMADVHLGNRQYGLEERADDFAAAFYEAIKVAIDKKVDFVLIAGDLFHKRQVEAMTVNQAILGLQRLRQAGIPCVAVEGNHEIPHYRESIGWVRFLALQGALVLLRPNLGEGNVELAPYAANQGSYIDVIPGVRVHGLHSTGAAAGAVLQSYAQAMDVLSTASPESALYRIFLAHAGVHGVLTNDVASPTMAQWRSLDAHVDYVALGHIHKPFDYEDRLFNPGSLETCAMDEVAWSDRGVLLVDVDTTAVPPHNARRIGIPHRPFVRMSVKVDGLGSFDQVQSACLQLAEYKAREVADNGLMPIVEVTLTGVPSFAPQEMNPQEIGTVLQSRFNALHVLVKDLTGDLVLGATTATEEMSREDLEAVVFSELFAADPAYAANADLWAKSAMQVKRLVLLGASSDDIAAEVQASIAKVRENTPSMPAT